MYRFIESINCEEGQVKLLDLHQKRVDRTFERYFVAEASLLLKNVIDKIPSRGKYKCRIEYGANDYRLEYMPYQTPQIFSLQVVRSDNVCYDFKSVDRKSLTDLFGRRDEADDVIIVKNGLVTDSYFANLALYDGKGWWTPASPLLKGVRRQYLLSKGRLRERDIHVSELQEFSLVSLINAMNDLGDLIVDMAKVSI